MVFDSSVDLLILARTTERFVIVAVVVLCTLLFMRTLRREAQHIDVDLDTKAGAAKASATLAMPVFLLLVLVGFAYVAFSNPVTISRRTDTLVQDLGEPNKSATSDIQVVGYDGPSADDLQVIRSINLMIGSLLEIRKMTSGGFGVTTLTELDAVWIELDGKIDELAFAALRLQRHRDKMIEQSFGPDLVSKCIDEQVRVTRGQTDELSDDCRDVVGLLSGVVE